MVGQILFWPTINFEGSYEVFIFNFITHYIN